MARSKSKHIRLVMRRRKQHKQRMKRRKADAKAGPTRAVKKPASKKAAPAAAAEPHA